MLCIFEADDLQLFTKSICKPNRCLYHLQPAERNLSCNPTKTDYTHQLIVHKLNSTRYNNAARILINSFKNSTIDLKCAFMLVTVRLFLVSRKRNCHTNFNKLSTS